MEKDGQREGRSTVRPLRKGIQTSWKVKWEKRQCQLDGLKGIVYMKRKQGEDWVWKSVDLKVSVQVNLWSVVGGRGGVICFISSLSHLTVLLFCSWVSCHAWLLNGLCSLLFFYAINLLRHTPCIMYFSLSCQSVSCPLPSASLHASNWHKLSQLIVCFPVFYCCT